MSDEILLNIHPEINSTQTLQYLQEVEADEFGLDDEEFKQIRECNGSKCVVVSLACSDNYFDVIVVDKGIMIHALSDYHLGF